MKNIVIAIIVLLSFQLNAQYIIPVEQRSTYLLNQNSANHYFKDVNGVMDKFLGNWKYETATDKVEISIYKEENKSYGGGTDFKDILHIEFKYTKNGTVIFNTIDQNQHYYISGGRFDIPTNTNKYHLMYLEPGQYAFKAYQYLDIEYVPNNNGGQPQLNWVTFSEPKSASYYIPPQMPLNMVFTKQP